MRLQQNEEENQNLTGMTCPVILTECSTAPYVAPFTEIINLQQFTRNWEDWCMRNETLSTKIKTGSHLCDMP